MNETAGSALQAWQSFYVIVGSSAGALTGLQFVVLTLIADFGTAGARGAAISAFGSPNVFHFCAALFVSAIFSAPWGGLAPPGIAIAVSGAVGVIYSLIVLRRSLRQKEYKPVLEDWIWHAALPLLAYAALLHSGVMLARNSVDTLYVPGGAALLLVFIGIHTAWDTVMYVTVQGGLARAQSDAPRETPREAPKPEAEKR